MKFQSSRSIQICFCYLSVSLKSRFWFFSSIYTVDNLQSELDDVFVLFHFNILVAYLQYLQWLCSYDISQVGERMVVTNSDFFSIFNQRRGGLSEIILYFCFSFIPWINLVELSEISRKWYVFFFKAWCLEGSTAPEMHGPPLCGLTLSYNFNRPASLLPHM